VTPQQEPNTYFRATSAPCSARRGGPAPRFCHKARSMRFVTPKPENRVHWPGHGQEPCPVQTTRLAITRAGNMRNGLRTFYSPHGNDATPPSRHLRRKRPGAAPAAPLPLSHHDPLHGQPLVAPWIFDRSASPFSPNTDPPRSECRLFLVFHRRDVPPRVRNTSAAPAVHSRTLRPLRRIYSECRVQWPVHGNSHEP